MGGKALHMGRGLVQVPPPPQGTRIPGLPSQSFCSPVLLGLPKLKEPGADHCWAAPAIARVFQLE